MPKKPKIACSYKGCAALIDSGTGGKCDLHRKVENKRYNNSRTDKEIAKQYKTSRWVKLRRIALQRDLGLCRRCKIENATLVDHIVEIKDGGDMWRLENLQSLCAKCHSIKTAEEATKRGEESDPVSFIS